MYTILTRKCSIFNLAILVKHLKRNCLEAYIQNIENTKHNMESAKNTIFMLIIFNSDYFYLEKILKSGQLFINLVAILLILVLFILSFCSLIKSWLFLIIRLECLPFSLHLNNQKLDNKKLAFQQKRN
jgi:hypothetical protein